MSRTIPHRELRNDSAAVLRAVAAGETIEVTNHGKVVAVLVPPNRSAPASLRARPARVKGGFESLTRTRIDRPVQEGLDELRGDR